MARFRHSSSNDASVLDDPYLELVMGRRKAEARWGWVPFAAFIVFLLVYRVFGWCMPANDSAGTAAWMSVLVLAGWGLLALFHMIILPIWMLIASLRYWEVNFKVLGVVGVLFSMLAPLGMILMLFFWSGS